MLELGLPKDFLESNQARDPLTVYYFNIDLMYILRARIALLSKQLQDKLQKNTENESHYFCPNSNCQNK